MILAIKTFIEEIERNLGVKITIYNEKGEYLFGFAKVEAVTDFKKFYCDTQSGFTQFRIKFNGENYIARIEGVGTVYGNYAYLISELAENRNIKAPITNKEDFVHAMLYGEIGFSQMEKNCKKYGLLENLPVCAMLITCTEGRTDEILDIIKNYASNNDFAIGLDESKIVFVKYLLEDQEEYRSVNEYAEFLYLSILEETGMHPYVTVGGVVESILDIAKSYSQALTAFKLKDRVSLSGNVHSFKEFVFIKILDDLPKNKLNEYLELLMDAQAKEIFDSPEMTLTAEEFLENNLNISETSRKLYLHRNTLTYRLDKIERGTGLDIRKFSDALTFRLISVLSKQEK